MKVKVSVLSVLVASILAASSALAANPYPQGTVVEGHLQFGRVHIPLPAGRWTVSGSAEWGSGAYEEFYFELIQVEDDRVIGFIQGSTNPNPSLGTTWYVKNDCARGDMHYVNTKANYPRQQDCAWVNHFEMKFDSGWLPDRQTAEWLRERRLTIPLAMVSTGYRLADNSRYLDINYAHSPLENGFPPAVSATWDTSDWHPNRVRSHPDRSAFIEKLKNWVEENRLHVRDGFAGRPGGPLAPMLRSGSEQPVVGSGGSVSMPSSTQANAALPSAEQPTATEDTGPVGAKLRALETLRRQNLISEEEYRSKRREILEQF